MGVNKSQYTGKVYYGIIAGQVARRFKEHQEDPQGNQTTVERTIYNNDNTVKGVAIEEYYESIDGLITLAYVDTSGNFGSNLMFEMKDDQDEFVFQVKLGSSYGRAIMNRIGNVDWSQPVRFRPYQFPNPDNPEKNLVGCTIYQEGKGWDDDKVPYMWTKDNPGDMPDWETVEKEGKPTLDNTKQTNFLIGKFKAWAQTIGAISAPPAEPAEPVATTDAPPAQTSDQDADNLVKQYEEEQAQTTTPPPMSLETEHANRVAEKETVAPPAQPTSEPTPPPAAPEAEQEDDDLPF